VATIEQGMRLSARTQRLIREIIARNKAAPMYNDLIVWRRAEPAHVPLPYGPRAVTSLTSMALAAFTMTLARCPVRLLSSASSAALALPTDEPYDDEHSPHESDDHAYADEQIGDNDSAAALDAHRPSVGRMALPVHPLRCFHMAGSPSWTGA
jgi:hypothetical protein